MKKTTVPSEGIVLECDQKEKDIPVKIKDQVSHILISSTCLKDRVSTLAEEIIHDANLKNINEIEVIAVLKGAANFANVLAQEIFKKDGPAINFNYIEASSYGKGMESSGDVRISGDIADIRSKNALIVEDIVDTGLTLEKLQKYLLKNKGASSVKICTLLDKQERRLPQLKDKLQLDYVGFSVPNMFIAGYGIDCAEHFRELPYVVAVNEDYFSKTTKEKDHS